MDERMDDIRDRLARAEQDIKNSRDVFQNFKVDDFGSLKAEVHNMRNELNTKIDQLLEKVGSINMQLAKWAGGVAMLVFGIELAIKIFLK